MEVRGRNAICSHCQIYGARRLQLQTELKGNFLYTQEHHVSSLRYHNHRTMHGLNTAVSSANSHFGNLMTVERSLITQLRGCTKANLLRNKISNCIVYYLLCHRRIVSTSGQFQLPAEQSQIHSFYISNPILFYSGLSISP